MNSPLKAKRNGKENEFIYSPTKEAGKNGSFKINMEPLSQQLSKKETLSDMTCIVLQGLKPMDVNTSFDEEVPDEEEEVTQNSQCLHLLWPCIYSFDILNYLAKAY